LLSSVKSVCWDLALDVTPLTNALFKHVLNLACERDDEFAEDTVALSNYSGLILTTACHQDKELSETAMQVDLYCVRKLRKAVWGFKLSHLSGYTWKRVGA
jgi:hypothetical protein